MIKIGEWNHLEVVKEKDFGIYLAEKKYDDAAAVLDAYRNGTPVEDDNGADEEPDAED